MAAERSAGSIKHRDRTDSLQRRYSPSSAVHYTKSFCSTLSSNMVSQVLSFPTATNFTLKVKTKESILAFFSMKIHPREKMLHVSLGLKMKGKHQALIWILSPVEIRKKVPKSSNWSLTHLWAKSSSGSQLSTP